MCIIVAVCNAKGGTGKTASVSSLGTLLAKGGNKVLMVDLDTQANLTYSFIDMENNAPNRFIYDAIREVRKQKTTNLPQVRIQENLYLVPSGIEMTLVDTEMHSMIKREFILQDLLAPIQDDYDIIFLDCPPALTLITLNAFTAANRVSVPMTVDQLAYNGVKMIQAYLETIQNVNNGIRINDIFFTQYDSRVVLTKKWERAIREEFGPVVMDHHIRVNVNVKEAVSALCSVVLYKPDSKGSLDYMDFAQEFVDRLKKEGLV